MSFSSDFDILKAMMPKIPNGKHTKTHIALGWAALVLFPIWLPLALSYFFFWLLCMLGQGAHEFLLKSAHWLSETAQEKEEEDERESNRRREERRKEDEEWRKNHPTEKQEDADDPPEP